MIPSEFLEMLRPPRITRKNHPQMNDLVRQELQQAIAAAHDLTALDAVRVQALGKNGVITAALKALGSMDGESRKTAGATINVWKDEFQNALNVRQSELQAAALEAQLANERVDITLPPYPAQTGQRHPITQTIDDIVNIFAQMGFSLRVGPDIEDDFHNFEALNFPPDHPARTMHDTFYLPKSDDGKSMLLRTHTSTVQVRTMLSEKLPIKMICVGRTYRADYDQTHTPMFHQCEGMVIDEKTHMGDMKGVLQAFLQAFFGVPDLRVRLRPSFFPFVEPGAELDIGCDRSGGQLKIGAGDDWLEVLGCGMVHENVLQACGIDPNKYQGYAFGMGIERLAMLKYGIPDLRTFFDSDIRWLQHYGFGWFR